MLFLGETGIDLLGVACRTLNFGLIEQCGHWLQSHTLSSMGSPFGTSFVRVVIAIDLDAFIVALPSFTHKNNPM